jgi:hypothetical protein
VAGALGRDHDHVDVRGRLDQAEMHVEAVREGERRARLHIALEVLVPDAGLMLVGGEDHQDVGPAGGFLVAHHLEAGASALTSPSPSRGAARSRRP